MSNNIYFGIDMTKTGMLLKKRISEAGYTVKDIQKLLNLSCPQPIYRWYKGQILPTLEHLFILSRFLGVHMEELLVAQENISCGYSYSAKKRLLSYWQRYMLMAPVLD